MKQYMFLKEERKDQGNSKQNFLQKDNIKKNGEKNETQYEKSNPSDQQ